MGTNNKQLIFDVSVIVNLWLGGKSASQTEELMNEAKRKDIGLWFAAASVSTLDFVAKQRFKQAGLEPDAVKQLVANLMDDLFQVVGVLSNHGFEQKEVYQRARDFEDAQLAAAIRSLKGASVCIVSEDATFDALGEVTVMSPLEALTWLHRETADEPGNSIPFIDLASQQAMIRSEIEGGIERVLRHGQYIMGPEVAELEEKLAAYVGVKHCITVASGTEALLISLMALGVGLGDEVITTPFTFVATAEVIVLLGATPVFVDIEADTCNIDASKIEAAISSRTKAIMPVSLYGQPADMDEINAIAAKVNQSRVTSHQSPIVVIEDADQSFGATYKGRKSCNLSTIGCTSFFPSKPLGCYGDGGAVFTSDDAIANACREIRLHGQSKRYVHTRIGVGGRMDTIQCAILLAKLKQFDWEIEQRLEIGNRYNALMDEHGILRVQQRIDRTSVFAQYTILVENREELQETLKAAGIPTAVHYPVPLDEQPAYKHLVKGEGTPVSREAAKRVMSLPMHPYHEIANLQRIAKELSASIVAFTPS